MRHNGDSRELSDLKESGCSAATGGFSREREKGHLISGEDPRASHVQKGLRADKAETRRLASRRESRAAWTLAFAVCQQPAGAFPNIQRTACVKRR